MVTSRSSTATSHSLPREVSPSAGSSTSLGSSGRPGVVAASASSRAGGAEVPRPEHEGTPRVVPAEAIRAAPPIGPSRHETTPATTVAGPTIGPRTARSGGVGAKPTSWRPSRMMRWLCSCSTGPWSCTWWYHPPPPYSTSTSCVPESSSEMAPTTTGSTAGTT